MVHAMELAGVPVCHVQVRVPHVQVRVPRVQVRAGALV